MQIYNPFEYFLKIFYIFWNKIISIRIEINLSDPINKTDEKKYKKWLRRRWIRVRKEGDRYYGETA